MAELGIAVLAALLGVIGGFLIARNIDLLGARRVAYASYIGAVDVVGWDIRRRLFAIRDHPTSEWPPMADFGIINRPLGETWLVATPQILEVADRMHKHLRDMAFACQAPEIATATHIDELLRTFDDLREELFNAARRETGTRPLPTTSFRDY